MDSNPWGWVGTGTAGGFDTPPDRGPGLPGQSVYIHPTMHGTHPPHYENHWSYQYQGSQPPMRSIARL